MTDINCRKGATAIANRSGLSLARLLGEISPKMRTTTVITAVEMAEAALSQLVSVNRSINHKVATEDSRIFTMLFPTRMVESSLS